MLCKVLKGTKFNIIMLVTGLIMLSFGIVKQNYLPESAHLASRLMGMLTGSGSAFAIVGAIRLIYKKLATPEKLKLKRIEEKDERNTMILRRASVVSNIAAALMLGGFVYLFTIMGSITESYICLAALFIQCIIFLTTHYYYKKTM